MLPIKHSNFNVNSNYTMDLMNLRLYGYNRYIDKSIEINI